MNFKKLENLINRSFKEKIETFITQKNEPESKFMKTWNLGHQLDKRHVQDT